MVEERWCCSGWSGRWCVRCWGQHHRPFALIRTEQNKRDHLSAPSSSSGRPVVMRLYYCFIKCMLLVSVFLVCAVAVCCDCVVSLDYKLFAWMHSHTDSRIYGHDQQADICFLLYLEMSFGLTVVWSSLLEDTQLAKKQIKMPKNIT